MTLVVRSGADAKIGPKRGQHTFLNVYREMLSQICRDYPGLPDPRTLTPSEIRFFYESLRAELKQRTSARPK